MPELFGRRATVTIGEKGKEGLFIDGLRVKFRVEQSSEPTANKARVEIYNLSKANRERVEKPGNYLILRAGYQGLTGRVFEGDVPSGGVLTTKSGPDYITVFECADGQKALTETMVNQSFKPGTNIKDVFKTVVGSFGLAQGPQVGLKDETFLQGLSLSGKASDILTTITSKQGLQWSVQDGVLQIYPKGGSVGGTAVFLSSNTGLIESPKRGDKKIEIRSLLQSRIRPGQLVVLDSAFLKGQFVVQKVIHEGDTFEKPFYSTIEIDLEQK